MITDSTLIDKIEISSELNNLNIVENFINSICEKMNFSEDVYGNVLIAVTEAVNNAIIHGNCFQKDKKVVVEVFDAASALSFSIKDAGKGFDYENLPDPTAPENIEKENGRGIFLIKNLSDNTEFVHPGNQIIISFSHD